MDPQSGGSITDLKILEAFIQKHGLDYVIGPATKADGSCFLWALKQNMQFYKEKGIWKKTVPEDVEMLRLEIIEDMVKNKTFWTERRFNPDIGRDSDPPLNSETFQTLIEDQEKERSYTDNQGLFVLASCLFLDIELHVLNTSVNGEIDKEGINGPLQIINKAKENERVVFHVGLLKDANNISGHFQFIFKGELNNNVPAPRLSSPTPGLSMLRSSSTSSQSPSPLKLRRSMLIKKYLRSPSAKTPHKENHCMFCDFVGSGIDLETHLIRSSECKKYYLRNFKTKCILAICVREFKCLFCVPKANIYTVNHLKSSTDCRRKYFAKFKVQNINELKSVLDGFRKMLRPSVVNRKLEMQNAKAKREEETNNKTENDLLNSFRQDNTFSNFACCFKCSINYPIGRLEEVNPNDIDISLVPEVKEKRRFQRYYICSICEGNKESNIKESPIKLLKLENESNIVLAPDRNIGDDQYQSRGFEADGSQLIRCILPCSVDALELFEPQLRTISPRQSDIGLMYKDGANIQDLVSLAYENELFKYYSVKKFGDCFQGVIRDLQSKTLTSATKVVNDNSVVGSETWRKQQETDLYHRLEQLGSICVFISVKVPIESDDVLATCVLQQDQVITVKYIGDSSMEMETQYLVHLNHSAGRDCSENCQKIPLSEYLEETSFDKRSLRTRYLTTYISSVVAKLNSLIKNFIKAPSSKLTSDNFYFQLHFEEDGSVKILGLLWPKALEKLNMEYSKYPDEAFNANTKDDCVKFIESVTCATSGHLEEVFSLSKCQAKKLSELIIKHQCQEFPEEDKDSDHLQPILPSLLTLILEYSVMNLEVSQQFSRWMKQKLKKVSPREMTNYATENWLRHEFDSDEIVVKTDHEQVKIEFDGHTFLFQNDDRLKSLILMFQEKFPDFEKTDLLACYHYSISTGTLNQVGGAVLKRLHLCDAYSTEYNVSLLKAFSSEVIVRVVNGNSVKDVFRSECSITSDLDIDEKVMITHQELTLTETLVIFDKKLCRSQTSNPVSFVAAYQDRKKYFRKVGVETEKSFKVEHSVTNQNQYYEPLLTGVDRFFMMEPGSNMVLAEFFLFYDYAGEKESAEILKLFRRSKDRIQDSEIKSAFSDKSCLKELLFLQNGDVMKIRRSKKVIAYPSFPEGSKDFMFKQVLMFSPDAFEEMNETDVESLFYKKDDPPVLDQYGCSQTIISRIERFVLDNKDKILKLTINIKGPCSQEDVLNSTDERLPVCTIKTLLMNLVPDLADLVTIIWPVIGIILMFQILEQCICFIFVWCCKLSKEV